MQGVSRGGYNGDASNVILFYKSNIVNYKVSDSKSGQDLLINYINEQVCKRKVVNLYLNSIIVDKCVVNKQELCDLYVKRASVISEQIDFTENVNINWFL